MKKTIALGLAGVMMMASLVGCGTSSSEKSSKEQDTKSEASSAQYLVDVDYSKYVDLCEYKGVKATKVVFDVTDAEIQEEIEMRMYDYATYDPVTDRGVEIGDYANITYTTTIDGAVNEDYSGEEEDVLVGEGFVYPELEDALVGMNTGENKTVEVELTEEFVDEEFVGKTASIDVTLNEITIENMPEYNLEFVKENFEFDTVEAFEESVKNELQVSKEEEYKYVAVEDIMAYMVENSQFDGYPEELYTQCEEWYDSENEYYASMYSMTVEEYLEMFGIDEETKKKDVEASVNYELVIGAIAQKEKINYTEEEVTEYVEGIYEEYGYESVETFLEDYSIEEIGYDMVYQGVIDFLYENATFNEKPEDEYLEEQEAFYEETEEDLEEEDSTEK